MRKLLTIMLSILLLVGCTTTPKYADVDHLVAEDIVFSNEPELKLYQYTTEEELEMIKQSEPYKFEGGERLDGEEAMYKCTGSITLLNDTEEKAYILGIIEIPYQDGTYLAKINGDEATYAFVFTVGSGEYVESWIDELCMNIKNRASGDVSEYIVFDEYKHPTDHELGYYLGSLSYSTEPVEGDYFNDFDLYVAPWRSDEYKVYEFRNGNEVHYNDQVVYITEPITKERYSILTQEPKNMMEVLGITREDIEDCIISDIGYITPEEAKATARSIKDNPSYEAFLDDLFNLNMYETDPMTVSIGASGYVLEVVTKDGSTYEIRNDSLELTIVKDGKIFIKDVVGDFYVTSLINEHFEKINTLVSDDISLTDNIKIYEYTNNEELEIIKNMTPYQFDGEEYIQGVDRNYPFKGNIVLLDDPSREINTFTTNIKIPFENGTYLADFSIDDKNYAFTFKVRNGVYQEKWFTRSSGGTLSINGVEYYGGGGIGQYMSSLSYSTEPVEGDYFNDFDMIYEDNGEKIVYEYRNGNEVHFNDTVIYITEPIRHERYAILYKDAQNVMEVLGITRENIADCIVFESGTGMTLEDVKATRRSVKDEDTYQDFLDRLFTLEMYEARPLTIAVGGQGSSVELVLTDGTVYVMDNFSMELYIAKNGESVFSDAVGTFSISGLVDEFDY
ncbi:MAG: hypothetical protein E7191_00535 [Erysipelotrichaceae bacterium]|nr:hypothetical protein [Erysipelotrichaceae bacterium]